MPDQQGNVFFPVSEGRKRDLNNIQAIKEIFPKSPVAHHFFERLIRRRDDADINRHGFRASYRMHFPLLQDAQEFHLQMQGQIADFI